MSDADRRALLVAAVTTLAVGGLAGVVARITVLVPMAWSASTIEARLGAALVVVLGVAVAVAFLGSLTVFPLYAAISERVRLASVPWVVFLVIGAVGCVGVGFVGIQPFATGFAEAHTDTYGGYGGPSADFEVSVEWVGDDRAIVTFTHAGGAPLYAEHLFVRGEGFTDVEGVDHTGPGQWQGTVSGERPRRGGAAVVTGDEVTIGVEGDCSVVIAYEGDGMRGIHSGYNCPELRTEA